MAPTEGSPPDALLEATLQALEWQRFLELAANEARTSPGKSLTHALSAPANWAADAVAARLRQQETQEVTALLDRDALWGPLAELADPAPALKALSRGSVLEAASLSLLRGWLYAVDSWSRVPRDELRGERLRRALASLPDPHEPLRVLDRVLTPEGELSERASPRLASLHAEIRALRREIGSLIDQLLKTYGQRGVLQESFSDVRDGRYVLPVKISAQSEIEGTLYEASVSRQTVFVEPKEVSPLNNRLRQRQNDLIQETYAVLKDTAGRLRPFGPEIAASVDILAHWDAVQARARLGRHYGGKPIQVTDERTFLLRQTAHPLLWWSMPAEQIVRNEIDFGEAVAHAPKRGIGKPAASSLTLLLTGPNTGGKTVLLKTLGMAGLCARTGFPFPATDHPTVPFFDGFFCDLGDPQSIERHLSSFSGHILQFRGILADVTARSLVLVDELNTATDPEEGAALGRAVLETLMGRGAMIVATTHDPQLKALALTDDRILNASMAFDEASRSPTYRMLLGVPGRSRALETAERLGLPSAVLELARRYVSREHREFEGLLGRLESDAREAARARKEAVTLREEAERLKKEWLERTQSSVNELLDRTRQKLRRVLEQAQDEVRGSVRKLDEMRSRRELDHARGQLNQAFTRAAGDIDAALREEAPKFAATLEKEGPPAGASPAATAATARPLEAGTRVRVPKWKSTGTLLEIQGTRARVSMGTLQMTLSLTDVEPIPESPKAQPASRARLVDVDRPSAPAPQLDLRGTRFEEAMSGLTAYLDQAFRSGALREVTIIHGLGSGALREGARKLISGLPYVKEFRDGGAGHGGAGATVVEFDLD